MSAGGTIEQLAALYGRPRSSHSDAAQLRVPPQSVEAEQAVLGGLMLAPDAYGRIADQLGDQDFYRRDHQLIYRAIRELAEKNRPYDAVTLGEWF
ncbi:MAG: DnaB-like helicase N-terminal domain-containing protein, partial [Burkholderiales bacterium]